jgi:large subunit ribosomal protein L7/L12
MPKCRFCEHNNPTGIDRCQNCGSWIEQAVASASPTQGAGDPTPQPNDFEGLILSLVKQGHKIAAIKLYREQTGSGLAEAKAAVETLAAGQRIERRNAEADGIKAESLEGQVLAFMQGQKKIEAIKLYREQTGVGLKEAKDAVESLAAKYGINPKGAGCAGIVLLMVIAMTVIGFGTGFWPG